MPQQISFSARNLLARFYCLWVMIWWLTCFINHETLTQLGARVFILRLPDPAIIALNYVHILKWMVRNYTFHLIIDLAVTLLPVLLFIKPHWKLLYLLLFISLSLYDLTFAAGVLHHSHPLYGIIIFGLAFSFITSDMFGTVWEGMRYVTATIYVITFFWKFLFGTLFHATEAVATVEVNLAGLLAHDGHTFYTGFIAYFIRHPYILQVCYTIAILIEGSFAVAFFTKRFDVLLILLGIILHYVLHLFVDVNFTVFYIMLLPFVPVRFVEKSANKMKHIVKTIQV